MNTITVWLLISFSTAEGWGARVVERFTKESECRRVAQEISDVPVHKNHSPTGRLVVASTRCIKAEILTP